MTVNNHHHLGGVSGESELDPGVAPGLELPAGQSLQSEARPLPTSQDPQALPAVWR